VLMIVKLSVRLEWYPARAPLPQFASTGNAELCTVGALTLPHFRREVVVRPNQVIVVALAVAASFATSVFAAQAPGTRSAAGERFQVACIKAVRPTLVTTIDALKKGDMSKAKG
jgi:hypothetical protein